MTLQRALAIVAITCAAAFAGTGAARADDPPGCYALAAAALTGPATTDLSLDVTATQGCAAVTALKHVQIKTYTAAGKLGGVENRDDVTPPIALGRVDRGLRIEVQALVATGDPAHTVVLRRSTTSRLRPDLAVKVLDPPLQTLSTQPTTIRAEVSELNGDVGATAAVGLAGPLGPLADPVTVTVPAHGTVPVVFSNVALTEPVTTELRAFVQNAAPTEYDTADEANDLQAFSIEVTKNAVDPATQLVASLTGYGGQLNAHLEALITQPPATNLPDLEAKVDALHLQLVRIFFNENWEWNADGTHRDDWPGNLASFKDVVRMANDAGATIVLAYQTTTFAKAKPDLYMARFADLVRELVVDDHFTNVRWISIGNEPNSTILTLAQYEALYRALDAQLRVQGIRGQVDLMGGDLVQNTEGTPNGHRAWFDYMVGHMNDVLDGWSEHIYWQYDQPTRMEERLKDVAYLTQQELPTEARKPTFIMEFGVRGVTSCAGKPDLKYAYYPDGCQDMRRLPLAAFHKLAFLIDSAQLGFDGAAVWDVYWSTYDRTKNSQSFWMIGPPDEGWALYPSYYALQLLLSTTAKGWQVERVQPWTAGDEAEPIANQDAGTWTWDAPEQELTSYVGPDGLMTIAGLDTKGRQLVAPNGQSSDYSIGGLPRNTTFTLAEWNANGDGTNSIIGTVDTGPAGVARFSVPLAAAFVLTTVPMS